MNKISTLCLVLIANVCLAQFTDDFSDGDFTSDPEWVGQTARFGIDGGRFRLMAPAVADKSYVVTSSHAVENASWEFYLRMDFNPSSSNFARVYVMADKPDLQSAINGYYVQIGGTQDEICLYKQSGNIHEKIVDGLDGRVNQGTVEVKIKVTRDVNANWELFSDLNQTGTWSVEGSASDASHTTSEFFGLYCEYTATRSTSFYFDDFVVSGVPVPDTTPPFLQTISANSPNELSLVFSETLDPTTATALNNFSANNGLGQPASANLQPDGQTVILQFATAFTNGVLCALTATGITDLAGNTMAETTMPFRYFDPQPASYNDLVINELFPDPNPVIGLPEAEFVELYNRGSKPFNLAGWKLKDPTSTATLPSVFLLPGEYLILSTTAAATAYSAHGATAGLSNFPTLNNTADAIVLLDDTGQQIDSVNYRLSWYQNEDKAQGGFTLERLNPEMPTNDSTNWMASEDAAGGTPGKPNSVLGRNPDNKPPLLLSALAQADRLVLTFNEPVFTDTARFVVSDGHELQEVHTENATVVLLFAKELINGKTYQLQMAALADLAGNLFQGNVISFRYFEPNPVATGVVLFNEIMADPSPVVQLPEAEYIELVNASAHPYDLLGWQLVDATDTISLPAYMLLPGEWLILCATSQTSRFYNFGAVLGVAGFPSLNNTGEPLALFSAEGILIDSVRYASSWYASNEKKEGGWSLERLRYEEPSHNPLNWRASEDERGGTPGQRNAVFGFNLDVVPPVWQSLQIADAHTLRLTFDEPLDTASALSHQYYTLQPGSIHPASIAFAEAHVLQLTFAQPLQNGITYALQVEQASDLTGNTMADTSQSFLYFVPAPVHPKDIIFTEVMADPTPVVQLPEAEYIELLNRSTHPIDLQGWSLTDGGTPAVFPPHIIQPGEYRIVTSTSQAQSFARFGQVVAVPNFPSLNNSGESLRLIDAAGITIDSIHFNLDWYRSEEKQEGGWSLELIDPNNPCGEEDNWTASESEQGGTPGVANSVLANKPDLTGPRLLQATPVSETELILTFNEKLDRSVVPASFTLQPAVEVARVAFTDTSLRTLRLHTATPLLSRTRYQLLVQRVYDCNGNEVAEDGNTVAFALPEPLEPGDVLISEILFNPPPGGVDFVELYNASPKYLSLDQLKLANWQDQTPANQRPVAHNVLWAPGQWLVFTPDKAVLQHQFPTMPLETVIETALPSLPDDAGALAVLNANDLLIDLLVYQASYHSPLLKNREGVSLERIAYTLPTQDPTNWTSASGTAGFATPGQVNSVARPEVMAETGEVVVTPEIIAPLGTQGFAQIQFRFAQSGCIANVKIVDPQGRSVKEVAHNQPVGYEGFFRWEGDQDDGTRARSGYYLVWFEVFDAEGNLRTYRKRVVVANR
ncbi:MAG: lamin tail domain-containing protein [Bacteroidota bacterium]